MAQYVILDFETWPTSGSMGVKEVGAWRYAENAITRIICLGYSVDGAAPEVLEEAHLLLHGGPYHLVLGITRTLLDLVLDPAVYFVPHNAGFEKAIWRKIMVAQLGWPDIPNKRWHDTQAMCAMHSLPIDLDSAAQELGLAELKDKTGKKALAAHMKPRPRSDFPSGKAGTAEYRAQRGTYNFTAAAVGKTKSYNLQDIRTQKALHQKLGWMPHGERDVWLLDQRINERGVKLDIPFIDAAQSIVDQVSAKMVRRFKEITGYEPGQNAKVLEWARSEISPSFHNLRKETLAAVLGGDIDEIIYDDETGEGLDFALPTHAEEALRIRQIIGSSSIKKLERMKLMCCDDGRARGLLMYHGAHPGRWSGRGFQPQNFPVGTLKLGGEKPEPELLVQAIMTGDPEYVEATFGGPIEVVVSSLRHAIVAEDDRLLGAGDFAGVEARVVLALAGQHDKTALMAAGKDVYLDMAEDIYRKPKGSLTKHDEAERKVGKNSVLGLGFQMGAKKFRFRYCPDQPIEFAQGVVDVYRKTWAPEVPKLWRGFEDAAYMAVKTNKPTEHAGIEFRLEGEWLSVCLPSGRKLWYFNPKITKRTMPWDAFDVREGWSFQVMKNGRFVWVDAYGGLITENIVQAIARDLMVHAMFLCERAGLPIVLTIHDEILMEFLKTLSDASELISDCMLDSPAWARYIRIPIAIDKWIGRRFRK